MSRLPAGYSAETGRHAGMRDRTRIRPRLATRLSPGRLRKPCYRAAPLIPAANLPMTVGHLVHLHVHGNGIRVDVGLVTLRVESEEDVAQNVGAEVIIHLSQIDALMQTIAESFEMGYVRLDLLRG